MKKFCFVQLQLNRDIENDTKRFWKLEADSVVFRELLFSLRRFTQFELVHFNDLDSNTSLFITLEDFQHEDYQIEELKRSLKNKSFKNVFYDFSTHDNQNISEKVLDKFEQCIPNVPSYFITKNIISKRKNHFWFEVLFPHYIENTPVNDEAFKAFRKIEHVQTPFLRKYKGMFHVGHIRYHKVKFLNFLHENNFLNHFMWGSTGIDYDPGLFPELVPEKFQEDFKTFSVLSQLPHFYDYDGYGSYNQRGNSFNLVSYLDSYFEIAPETKFYHTRNQTGAMDTEETWNNISEKTMRPTFAGHPFILLSKPNTISTLETMGLKYRFDFWNHSYDAIENDDERMEAIQHFTKRVMNMEKHELASFKIAYNEATSTNYHRMYHELYPEKMLKIYNEA